MEERIVARFRAGLIFSFLLLLLGALGVRLFWIQVVDHDHYAAASRDQHISREVLVAPRGDITDRTGRVLATSRLLPSVAVDPALLADPEAAATALAGLFGVDRAALRGRLAPGRRFAWVRRGVEDPALLARARELPLGKPKGESPLIVVEEQVRFHPSGRLAPQLLGTVDIDGKGIEGLEKSLDARLHGVDGRRTVVKDALRKSILIPGLEETPAVPGTGVRLTLDAVIQGFAEDELRRTFEKHSPAGAVCVVLEVGTGNILALASAPTFDPGATGPVPGDARRARYATDMFEPGSTFKPLIVAGALESGAVAAGERLDTGEGWIRVGNRTIREHDARGHGMATMEQILAVSSNCGMARIGLRLGIPRTQALLGALGFGRTTGLGLPGEVAGRLTPPAKWTETYTLVSVSFGQEIAVTPLQLAAAFLPVAGDGTRPPLRLVEDGGAGGRTAVRVLSPETARRVLGMMESVLTEGTARTLPRTGYRLAGKTGTAQKLKGGETAAYVSSFVGIGPVEEPRLICLVLLDEPSRKSGTPYGSKVAAPYCTEVLRKSLRYLGVRPDEGERGRP